LIKTNKTYNGEIIMKLCPHCGANVEGFIHHCVCCGGLLNPPKKFVRAACFQICPHWGDFIKLMLEEINAIDVSKYEKFLKNIDVACYCYPNAMYDMYNVKPRLRYYKFDKRTSGTIAVDYVEFVYTDETKTEYSDKKHRMRMVAEALKEHFHLVEARMNKSHYDISEFIAEADKILNKYIK
jgi:hypothetical protein